MLLPCVSEGGFLQLWPSRGGEGWGGRGQQQFTLTIIPHVCTPHPWPSSPHPINYACFYYPLSSSSGAGQWPANSYSLMCVFTVIMTHNAWTIYTSVCRKKQKKLNSLTSHPPPRRPKAVHIWALRFLFLCSSDVCGINKVEVLNPDKLLMTQRRETGANLNGRGRGGRAAGESATSHKTEPRGHPH